VPPAAEPLIGRAQLRSRLLDPARQLGLKGAHPAKHAVQAAGHLADFVVPILGGPNVQVAGLRRPHHLEDAAEWRCHGPVHECRQRPHQKDHGGRAHEDGLVLHPLGQSLRSAEGQSQRDGAYAPPLHQHWHNDPPDALRALSPQDHNLLALPGGDLVVRAGWMKLAPGRADPQALPSHGIHGRIAHQAATPQDALDLFLERRVPHGPPAGGGRGSQLACQRQAAVADVIFQGATVQPDCHRRGHRHDGNHHAYRQSHDLGSQTPPVPHG
jgi:hypothetical protein